MVGLSSNQLTKLKNGGSIDTGMYFIVTSNYYPLKGNGWYFDDTVDKALKYNLIANTMLCIK